MNKMVKLINGDKFYALTTIQINQSSGTSFATFFSSTLNCHYHNNSLEECLS